MDVQLFKLLFLGMLLVRIEGVYFTDSAIYCTNLQLSTFPSPKCTNSSHIVKLYLTDNRIQYVNKEMFSSLSNLSDLHLNKNGLEKITKGSFDNMTSLTRLNLGDNKLKSLPHLEFMSGIAYLTMSGNPITELSVSVLKHYPDLEVLDLSDTQISQLPLRIFAENKKLRELHMTNTPLTYIDENAFQGVSLTTLKIDGTKISNLPTIGMDSLTYLNVYRTTTLWQLPYKLFKKLLVVRVNYHFHCCLLKQQHNPYVAEWNSKNFNELPLCNKTNNTTPTTPTTNPNTPSSPPTADESDPFNKWKDRFPVDNNETVIKPTPKRCVNRDASVYPTVDPPSAPSLDCQPQPDAFNPCEDIMGTMGLRVCSWAVAIFAIMGNGFQLVVLASSRRSASMYRILMSNLAIANFFMGIYLGMVVSADAHTFGEYQNHARAWQFGTGCKLAGFLSILSTELAVYTLTIVTLERYYTIVHPLKNDMHLSVKQVTILMTCGWLFALTLATLPLVGVSSYNKVAICLPFNVENPVSAAYVTFLLITNGLAFLSVLFCYGRMYCSLGGARCSTALRVESRVAKRMALLVFSNFTCWFPIALFSLVAIYGTPVIDVSTSKFLLVFVYPINAFTNPYLYALGTKHFQLDVLDLVKRFGLCQKSIDKLSNKLLDQLASLPNTSKAYMGSKTSLNSYRVSPNNSVSGSLSDPQRRSIRSKASTNSKDSGTSCAFLALPRMGFSSCTKKQDEHKRYSSDYDSVVDTFDHETAPLHQHENGTPNKADMKIRRTSAREVIIAGAKLSNISCNCNDAKHTIQDCRKAMDNQNKNTTPPGEGNKNGTEMPMVMVTPC